MFRAPLGGGPRRGLSRAVAIGCRRAFGTAGPRYTLESLRRFWQAAARDAGLARSLIRETWWVTPAAFVTGVWPPHVEPAALFARRWSALVRSPVAGEWEDRAPMSTERAWKPERRVTTRPPLPPSCSMKLPEPEDRHALGG